MFPMSFCEESNSLRKSALWKKDRVKYRNASSAGKYSIGTGEDFETKMLRLVEQYGAEVILVHDTGVGMTVYSECEWNK